ncbi:hypothetical protein PGB90_006944 [Kerria lacca]
MSMNTLECNQYSNVQPKQSLKTPIYQYRSNDNDKHKKNHLKQDIEAVLENY